MLKSAVAASPAGLLRAILMRPLENSAATGLIHQPPAINPRSVAFVQNEAEKISCQVTELVLQLVADGQKET